MRTLKVGVIGCGGIAQQTHLPVLKRLTEFSVQWVCDLDSKRALQCAEQFRIPEHFAVLDECSDVDAVLVCTPVGPRKKILQTIARRGWHAFCEKPFALSRADHLEMLRLSEDCELVLGAGYMRRFYGSTMAANKLVACWPDNSPLQVVASDCQRIRRNPHSQDWYLMDAKSSGGGFLMESGSHLVDQALTIVGNPAVNIDTACQKTFDGLDYETTARGTGELRDGRTVEFHLSVSRLRDVWSGIRISSGNLELLVSLGGGAPLVMKNLLNDMSVTIPSALTAELDISNAYIGQLAVFGQRVLARDYMSNAHQTGLETTSVLSQCSARNGVKEESEVMA